MRTEGIQCSSVPTMNVHTFLKSSYSRKIVLLAIKMNIKPLPLEDHHPHPIATSHVTTTLWASCNSLLLLPPTLAGLLDSDLLERAVHGQSKSYPSSVFSVRNDVSPSLTSVTYRGGKMEFRISSVCVDSRSTSRKFPFLFVLLLGRVLFVVLTSTGLSYFTREVCGGIIVCVPSSEGRKEQNTLRFVHVVSDERTPTFARNAT